MHSGVSSFLYSYTINALHLLYFLLTWRTNSSQLVEHSLHLSTPFHLDKAPSVSTIPLTVSNRFTIPTIPSSQGHILQNTQEVWHIYSLLWGDTTASQLPCRWGNGHQHSCQLPPSFPGTTCPGWKEAGAACSQLCWPKQKQHCTSAKL